MKLVTDWLAAHPEARVNKPELFGLPADQVHDLPLTDPGCVVDYVEALSDRAGELGAPHTVQQQFASLLGRLGDRVTMLDEPNTYLRRTLRSLIGVQDARDIGLVIKGAIPHAPTSEDRDLVRKIGSAIKNVDPEALSAVEGSPIWCVIACVLCDFDCVQCCLMMM